MDKITHDVRLSSWQSIIEQCHSRPKGQTIAAWCKENSINEKQYYYWQRRVRQNAVRIAPETLLPAMPKEETEVSFAEISFHSQTNYSTTADDVQDFHPEAVIRKGDLVIGLKNSISDRLLDRILKGVSNAV